METNELVRLHRAAAAPPGAVRSWRGGGIVATDPESVGAYRLLRRLGAGGIGQVYLARSPGGRLVAVKVIRPDLAAEHEFRARFAREVAAARTVSGSSMHGTVQGVNCTTFSVTR
jgi:serine/threonine protein kinase